MSDALPPCGLYVTTGSIASVPAGRLVYFHNHGNPGPGVYLPESWTGNRARFQARGTTLPDNSAAKLLSPLAAEGFYRVREAFFCCGKKCRHFEVDDLVQLGYDGSATPILFTPQLRETGIDLPDQGIRIDLDRIDKLVRLRLGSSSAPAPVDELLH
ncbi:MAG: hypothetical protein AAGF12_43135 [Myxococcota bacterium]